MKSSGTGCDGMVLICPNVWYAIKDENKRRLFYRNDNDIFNRKLKQGYNSTKFSEAGRNINGKEYLSKGIYTCHPRKKI